MLKVFNFWKSVCFLLCFFCISSFFVVFIPTYQSIQVKPLLSQHLVREPVVEFSDLFKDWNSTREQKSLMKNWISKNRARLEQISSDISKLEGINENWMSRNNKLRSLVQISRKLIEKLRRANTYYSFEKFENLFIPSVNYPNWNINLDFLEFQINFTKYNDQQQQRWTNYYLLSFWMQRLPIQWVFYQIYDFYKQQKTTNVFWSKFPTLLKMERDKWFAKETDYPLPNYYLLLLQKPKRQELRQISFAMMDLTTWEPVDIIAKYKSDVAVSNFWGGGSFYLLLLYGLLLFSFLLSSLHNSFKLKKSIDSVLKN